MTKNGRYPRADGARGSREHLTCEETGDYDAGLASGARSGSRRAGSGVPGHGIRSDTAGAESRGPHRNQP